MVSGAMQDFIPGRIFLFVAGYITVMIEAAGAVAALLLKQEMMQMVLSCSVCLILCLYWITYLVMSRKY